MNELQAFEKHLRENEKSPATIEKYIRDVAAFAEYVQMSEITKDAVLAYKRQIMQNYAARSVNSMLSSINSLFAFLRWHDLKVKTLKIQRQIFCSEKKELTKSEYARLCEAAEKRNERLKLILQTICGTGIRVSELRYITVEAAKQGEAVVNCKSKTRVIFIVKELRKKLLRYAAEQNIKTGMIFITKAGKPINRTNIWREMKSLCKAANVNPQKVFPHNLRTCSPAPFTALKRTLQSLQTFQVTAVSIPQEFILSLPVMNTADEWKICGGLYEKNHPNCGNNIIRIM